MNIHILQHVPFEGPGSIETWAIANGHRMTTTRLYAGDQFPSLERFDMLVIMGGPMSIHDESVYTWLKAEKWFIKQVIEAAKPILGICLGAQLLAEALGAEVYPGEHKEIGWYPITLVPEFADSDFGQHFPPQAEVFHWHGETFGLPDGSMRIAHSEACANQGFIYSDHIIALQFHLETTHVSAESIIDNSRDELVEGEFIQTESQMLGNEIRFAEANRLMAIVLEHLAMQVHSA